MLKFDPTSWADTVATEWVVLIHGIFSDHRDFEAMAVRLQDPSPGEQRQVFYYDYRWKDPIHTNALRLAGLLDQIPAPIASTTIVAHSMGSVVSRFALMQHSARRVRRLIMLGGPNLGAVRPASMAPMAQRALVAAGTLVSGLGYRGLRDLTEVVGIYSRLEQELVASGAGGFRANVKEVEYVTVPGEYWHTYRQRTIGLRKHLGTKGTLTMKGLEAAEFLAALIPAFGVNLTKPHDGIVEESSSRLIPSNMDRPSEKRSFLPPGLRSDRYVHVRAEYALDVDHLRLVNNADVLELVRTLVDAPSMVAWATSLAPDVRDRLQLNFNDQPL
jgi:hypothetical protein